MNTIRTTTLTKAERNRLYIRYLLYGCPGVDAVYIQGKSWPWWLLPFFKDRKSTRLNSSHMA